MINSTPSKSKKSKDTQIEFLPTNVKIGKETIILGDYSFQRFTSKEEPALIIGNNCTMDGVHFALGEKARTVIGDYCYFTNAIILCESQVQISDYVIMGWNSVIMDTDFHPIAPAVRIADALACSPLGSGKQRPEILKKPVIIEENVWIGPNAAIFKGVRVGANSFIEPGAIVTRNVPPNSMVSGNPAQVIGEIS